MSKGATAAGGGSGAPMPGMSVGAPAMGALNVPNVSAPSAAVIGQQLMQQFSAHPGAGAVSPELSAIVKALQGAQQASAAAAPQPLVNPTQASQMTPAHAQMLQMLQPYFSIPQGGLGAK